MNIDINKILLSYLILIGVYSCSPEYHKERYFKKGGQFTCDIDTLKVIDSVIVDGATVYKFRDSLVVRTETKIVPKWRVRFDNKRFNDSLRHVKKMYIKELTKVIKLDNNAVKNNRIDSRQEVKTIKAVNNCWTWWQKILFGIGFTSLGLIISFIRGLFKIPLNTFDR